MPKRRVNGVRDERERLIVQTLLAVARPILLEVRDPDCCIASTQLARDVLGRFGIASKPLTVRVHVYNPMMTALAAARGGFPENDDVTMWRAWGRQGGFTITMGTGRNDIPTNPVWPWHLVAIATLSRTPHLIDLSLDQLNRSDHDLAFAPLCERATPEFLAARQPLPVVQRGQMIVYEAFPDVTTYTTATEWAPNPRRTHEVELLVALIRQQLAESKKVPSVDRIGV